MLRPSLYALVGAYALQVFPELPSRGAVAAALLIALVAIALPRYRFLKSFAPVVLGGAIMWLAASAELADRLDPVFLGETLSFSARIVEFPEWKGNSLRLVVEPLRRADLPARIRLSAYAKVVIAEVQPGLGEVWHFQVRLKRPRGFANPSGFDYEGWLFRQHIGATGYVLQHERKSQADFPAPGLAMTLRRQLAARLDALFPAGESRAVLKAITVGSRGEISDPQWALYARTGTSHLMAISGLHIGLAASGSFVLVWALLALFPLRGSLRDVAMIAALVVAFCYAELSGFAVPAKRSFLMVLLAASAVLMRRPISVPHIFGVVCLAVLASDPLSIYAPGFMLSFLAVALLLWAAQSYRPPQDPARSWFVSRSIAVFTALSRIQIVLLLGLMPMTIALFERVAILAPLTNFLVVPIFNLLTIPACLLGLLFGGPSSVLGDLLLKLAFASVEMALGIIDVVGDLPIAAVEPPLSGYWIGLIAGATIVWAVLPVGWPGRHIAIVAFVSTLFYKPPLIPDNCLEFHALDVGQGLAVVMRTRDHTLLYDTGPSFRGGSNTARLVIGPFLKSLGISRIDVLVVSHSDLDHAGGVGWLLASFEVGQLLLGEELKAGNAQGVPCHAGQDWQWDGVRFRIVHPERAEVWRGNDGSCVLLVQAGAHKLLITGDIESRAERAIETRPVDLVLIPHHGSRTSSSSQFVGMLKPRLAIVSAGYRNRWGFPKADIVARWESVGTTVMTTAEAGAISRRFCAGQTAGAVRSERREQRRYWSARD